mmetsp:Transcript_109220/g.326645  ORF Transcript_109220/g.326645 Transcript_109220/m.326645 type:complete len:214 (+) Transcript_109220:40-681(+)
MALSALSSSSASAWPSASAPKCPNSFQRRWADLTSALEPFGGTAEPSCRRMAASTTRGATQAHSGAKPATLRASMARPCAIASSTRSSARASSTRSREQTAPRMPRPLRKREGSRSREPMRKRDPLCSFSSRCRCTCECLTCLSTSLVAKLQLRAQRLHSKSLRKICVNSSPGSEKPTIRLNMSSGSRGTLAPEPILDLGLENTRTSPYRRSK